MLVLSEEAKSNHILYYGRLLTSNFPSRMRDSSPPELPRARNDPCARSVESFVLHNGTAITERLVIVASDTMTKASLGAEGYADKGDIHPGHRVASQA